MPLTLVVVALAGVVFHLWPESEEERLVAHFQQRLENPPPPVEASSLDVSGAKRYRLSARQPATVRFSYGDGGFWLWDEDAPDAFSEDPMEETFDLDAVAGSARGVMFVSGWDAGDDVPLRLVLHRERPPVARRGWGQVAELDLETPSGRLLLGSTGDAGAGHVIRLPAAGYRVRVATVGSWETERFRMDLWPRPQPADPVVLKRREG